MIELSAGTEQRLDAIFSAADSPEARRLLEEECAENLPLLAVPATPQSLERIRFATLRLSDGDLEKLRYAVNVAKRDWRDVLVAAGFGHSIREHERWQPEPRRDPG
jgi:hypothetical protein